MPSVLGSIPNLRDPRARGSLQDTMLKHIVGEFLATFKEFPPSQKAGSFSLDLVLEKLAEGAAGGSR